MCFGIAFHTSDQMNLLYRMSWPHVDMTKYISGRYADGAELGPLGKLPRRQAMAFSNDASLVDVKSKTMGNRIAPCRSRMTCKQGHISHMTPQVKARRVTFLTWLPRSKHAGSHFSHDSPGQSTQGRKVRCCEIKMKANQIKDQGTTATTPGSDVEW